jgi:hypothetical protein
VEGEGDEISEDVLIDKLIEFIPVTEPDRVPRMVVGAYGGVVVPNHDLGVAAVPRLELGVRLPWREGAVVPFVDGSYGVAWGSGSGTEPQHYAFDVGVRTAQLAAGTTLRLTGFREVVNPEIGLAATLSSSTTVVETEIRGSSAGTAVETVIQPGLLALAGVSIQAGPGAVMLLAHGDGRRVSGDLSGGATLMQYGFSAGYRLTLRIVRRAPQPEGEPT